MCGVALPEGMKENDRFPEPIITPATKADEGHDEDISREDIIAKNIVPEAIYTQLEKYTRALFQRGTEMAAKQGLILVDTKYEFGIRNGHVETVHSYTNDQNLHDAPHRDLRRARAAAYSIIPTTTNAGKALDRVLPTLAGKIEASAMRVPVPDGSLTDLIVELGREVSTEEVNAAFRKAEKEGLNGYLQVESDPIVSMDILGNPHSCIIDEALTSAKGSMVKVVGWYDNESGYANRLVDLTVKLFTK